MTYKTSFECLHKILFTPSVLWFGDGKGILPVNDLALPIA